MNIFAIAAMVVATIAVLRVRRCVACSKMIMPWEWRTADGPAAPFRRRLYAHFDCYGEEFI